MHIDPACQVIEKGPSLGTYRGRDIPSYFVNGKGVRSEYDRIAMEDSDGTTPLSQLRPDECVIAPGLIYRRVS